MIRPGWLGPASALIAGLAWSSLQSPAADFSTSGNPSSGARWEFRSSSLIRRGPGGLPRLLWETTAESGVVGFDLVSMSEEGAETPLNGPLIPARNSAAGGAYAWDYLESEVPDASHLDASRLWLLIWGEDGRSTRYHLNPTEIETATPPPAASDLLLARGDLAKALVAPVGRHAEPSGLVGPSGFDAFTGLSGVYGATAGELAAALGLPVATVRSQLLNHTLGLITEGQPLAWQLSPNQESALFYLPEKRTLFQRGNVFQSAVDRSPQPAVRAVGVPATGASLTGFVERVFENDVLAVTTLPGGIDDDFWVWDNFLGTHPVLGSRTYPVVLPGVITNGGLAQVTIDLASTSETTHNFEATLNGRSLGSLSWMGRKWQKWTLPLTATELRTGTNQLVLTSKGDRTSLCYLDRLRFRYAQALVVTDGSLVFEVDTPGSVGVRAADARPVDVWDITVPTSPVVVGPAAHLKANTRNTDTGASTLFWGQAGHRYVAFRPEAPRTVSRWQSVAGSPLKTDALAVDYLVVTPDSLREPAGRLASLRESQGLASLVVTLTQLRHEFSDGVARADALRGLLAYARSHWRRAPRYVVLLGDGTYDYRSVQGGADNLLPPPLVMTSFGRAAADPQMLDLATAPTSIGRLSGKTVADLQGLIDRIVAYETNTASITPGALLLADLPDAGGDFIRDSDVLAGVVSGPLAVRKVYNTGLSSAVMQTQLRDELKRGVIWWNYLGHGGRDRMGTDYVTIPDVPGLNFGGVAPLVTGMTCAMGQFALPGSDCLGEALLLKSGVGPIAVWSPSGFSINYQASQLNRLFAEELLYARRGDRLGDLLRRSRNRFLNAGGDAITTEFYNLLGDPALRLPFAVAPIAPVLVVRPGVGFEDPPEMSVLGETGSEYRIEAWDPGRGSLWEKLETVRINSAGAVRAPIFFDARFAARLYRVRRE